MTSKGRAGFWLVVAALVAGIGALAVFREQDEDALRKDAGPLVDASVDGHADAAKVKPGNKKAGRGGKTRVSARAGGGGGVHGDSHPSGGNESTSDGDRGGGGAVAPSGGHHASSSGPSYESALDSNNQHLTIGANAGPDLTDAQLSAPMSDGAFVTECGAPDSMGVTVKVAIQMGRAVGVTVSTNPPAAAVAACIDRHIRGVSWPASAKMDSLVTTY